MYSYTLTACCVLFHAGCDSEENKMKVKEDDAGTRTEASVGTVGSSTEILLEPLDRCDVMDIRTMSKPPEKVHSTLMASALLLGAFPQDFPVSPLNILNGIVINYDGGVCM